MITRRDQASVATLLQQFPAVVLLGPHQVGKTTLAHAVLAAAPRQTLYLDLEQASQRAILEDPEAFLDAQAGRCVILDEVQRLPDIFAVLRGAIDKRRRRGDRAGHFLLLGSASRELLRQSAESLAGRAIYHELTPLLLPEVATGPGARAALRLWVRGGFPESFLAPSAAASLIWRQRFVQTYLERDIPALGLRLPANTLRRLWTMLAHDQGCLLNAARLAAALGLSGHTISRYLDVLVDLMLVRRLPPWAGNRGKRLVRSPKVYVRDSGLAHALLGLRGLEDVLAHPVAGASWEGFAIEHLLAHAGPHVGAFFYRSAAGAELDLVLEAPGGARWAIEVKRSSAPKLSRGFHTASRDLEAARRIVVHGGDTTFSLGSGVEAMPLPAACAAAAELAG